MTFTLLVDNTYRHGQYVNLWTSYSWSPIKVFLGKQDSPLFEPGSGVNSGLKVYEDVIYEETQGTITTVNSKILVVGSFITP